jgi:MYXO-CTERM domain-containing protein
VSYLNLPDGEVMVTCGGGDWLYTPDSAPDDAWRPTVTSVVYDGNGTYTLTGTQLSGLINGGDEGDDMTMAENYPIVWLKDSSGNVFFCRSFAFSNMMPSRGSTPETCQFTTPASLPNGTYDLYVSSVGVQSKNPFSFTVGVGGSADAGADAEAGTEAGSGADAGAGSEGGAQDAGRDASPSADSSIALDAAGAGGPGGSSSSGGGSSSGGSSGSGGDAATGDAGASATSGASSGCGCRAAGQPSDDRRVGAAWAFVLGALLASRVRRARVARVKQLER